MRPNAHRRTSSRLLACMPSASSLFSRLILLSEERVNRLLVLVGHDTVGKSTLRGDRKVCKRVLIIEVVDIKCQRLSVEARRVATLDATRLI